MICFGVTDADRITQQQRLPPKAGLISHPPSVLERTPATAMLADLISVMTMFGIRANQEFAKQQVRRLENGVAQAV